MAKTNFQNGTIVTSTYLNEIFGQGVDGGHVHDAVDDDGHCGKINPQNHILDTLTAINVDVISTYFSTPSNENWYYFRLGKLVVIFIPAMFGTHSTNNALQFSPNSGNWPSAIIPSSALFVGGIMLSKQGNPSAEKRIGILEIPSNSANNIVASINDDSAELITSGFGTAGTEPKGIYPQTISYLLS